MKLTFVFCLLLLVASFSNAEIAWQPGDWAFGCDFFGNALSSARVPRQQCRQLCSMTRSCTHFSWTSRWGGTCWMMKNTVRKDDAFEDDPTTICGIVTRPSKDITKPIKWQSGDWAFGCDFFGNALSSARVPREKCGPLCSTTRSCTHFSWTVHLGGTCWMMKNTVSKADAFDDDDTRTMCGIVAHKSKVQKPIRWQIGDWAFSCDFYNNDITTVQVPRDDCSDECAATDGCTHFTWSSGTCVMKGGHVSKSDAFYTGVKSMICGINTDSNYNEDDEEEDSNYASTDNYKITVVNSCREDIWVGAYDRHGNHPNGGGWCLRPGESNTVDVTPGFVGHFWPRTKCAFKNNRFVCATGDCGPNIQCEGGTGTPPVSKAEFSLLGAGRQDFWDINFVDGSSTPIGIAPVPGTFETGRGKCRPVKCARDLNANCPRKLRNIYKGRTVGCKSACSAFQQDRYCCSGKYDCSPYQPSCPSGKQACNPRSWPADYSRYFRDMCPDAHSFAFDHKTTNFSCFGRPFTSYVVTFCPS